MDNLRKKSGKDVGVPVLRASRAGAVRTVVQRVSRAEVHVDGRFVGRIGVGLLVLVGFAPGDGEEALRWMAEKLWGLRVFADAEGRMNRAATEVGGGLLLVSQFTLYGDVSRGRRPSFIGAAPPEEANRLYDRFVDICRDVGGDDALVRSGEFGAMMDVELVNDGPVTLVIDR